MQFYVQKSYFSLLLNTFKAILPSYNYLNINDIKIQLAVSEYNICSPVLGTLSLIKSLIFSDLIFTIKSVSTVCQPTSKVALICLYYFEVNQVE